MKPSSENIAASDILSTNPQLRGASSFGRRAFVKRLLAAGAAANVAGISVQSAHAGTFETLKDDLCDLERRVKAFQIRYQAAVFERSQQIPDHNTNGDEQRYPNKIASYSKGLPQNDLGEVDLHAYQLLLRAVCTGNPADFERIPLGCPAPRYKLTNPQAGLAFDLEGIDAHATDQPPAPAFASAEESGEIVENYWMALTRDIAFRDYSSTPLTIKAAEDLSKLSNFKGPKVAGRVTPDTLFRSSIPGCLTGPYISQFRWLAAPFGATYIDAKMRTPVPNLDFMTDYSEWLKIQRGCFPSVAEVYDTTRRYMRNGRDVGEWVHYDVIHGAYFMAMLALLYPPSTDPLQNGIGAPLNPGNPYNYSSNQAGFVTFDGPHIEALLPEVCTRALHAVWFQKWFVHRRLRPEVYSGRIHNYLTGKANYPVGTPDLLGSAVLDLVYKTYGSYLLPQAFPEGSPLHPSYGAGHATAAGACTTILKAFFDENFVIPNPVQATSDGLSLEPYTGPALTVGGELNKLAANVAISRNIAGVHWRTDATDSLKLGEAVAISILQDQKATYNEKFPGFTFTKFDGTKVTI